MSENDGEPPEVGSLGEEAARLMDALGEWAREQGHDVGDGVSGLANAAVGAARGVDEHFATGSEDCRYCPVCRAVHVVRQTSPEVRAHLATAAHSLLQAAAGLVGTAVPDEQRSPTNYERITVDDADGTTHDE